MRIARSTYYATPPAPKDDTAIVEAIAGVCDEFESYGWRRVQAALRQQGLIVNHKKIKRLMRKHGLQPKIRRRHVATTDSDHDQPIFPNLAKDMIIDGPDRLWVADITYVAIAVGFVYVAVILDAWSRHGPVTRRLPEGDVVDRLQSLGFPPPCYPNYGAPDSCPGRPFSC
jgi:putative transposase